MSHWEKIENLGSHSAMAEFAYNSSVNRTIGLSPFEIVTCFKPRQLIDLIPISHHHYRVSDSVSAFASHIHALREEIREKTMKNNVDYKASMDLHRRLRTFNVGDYVMVRMRPGQFSPGTVKRKTIPNPQEDQFKCYVVDLPLDFGISCNF